MTMSHRFGAKTTAIDVATAFSDRIKGRTVLVTGVSPDGLGSETVRALAIAGAGLITCASRNRAKVDKVFASIRKEQPQANLRFLELDLASIESCKRAGREVLEYKEPLHVVINNGGILGQYATTKDGLESMFGCNHIGHFAFTNTLLPKLLETAKQDPSFKPRIVNVASLAHSCSPVRFDDPGFSNGKAFSKWAGYGQSKTANILYSLGLASRLASHGILSYSLHPGLVRTEIMKGYSQSDFLMMDLKDEQGNDTDGNPNVKTLEQGAATTIVAAFSADIEQDSGAYMVDCQLSKRGDLSSFAASKDNADKLWKLSEKIVGETYHL